MIDPNFVAINAKLSEAEKEQAQFNAVAKKLDAIALSEALDPKAAKAELDHWATRHLKELGR